MSKRVWSMAIVLAVCSAVPLSAASGPVRIAADSEPAVYDVADRAVQEAELHRALVERESAKGLARAIVVNLSAEEKADAAARPEDGKLRVGIQKNVGVTLKLLPSLLGPATDGTMTWSGRVVAPGASGLRIHFAPFDLPESAELYVYAGDGQVHGPYTGRGPLDEGSLWTNAIFGDEVRIQLRIAPDEIREARIVIADIGYLGDGLPMASNLCAANADCVQNAACHNVSAVTDARDAVASILFASGGGFYICSGGLIADSDTSSVIPYFLTANHCISTSGEASSVETYFDYESGSCSQPNCTEPYNNPGQTIGATIMRTSSTSDFTLLRLSSAPTTPDGVVRYLGWSSTAVANSNGTALHRISHPQGSPQAYSAHTVDTSKVTCRSWPRGNWIYSRDTLGATEGGSSGSPVLNGSGQIVGQLSGGCGFNINDECDSASNATVDGAFAAYFSQVSQFLAGGPQCGGVGTSCTSNSQCCSGNCKGKPGAKSCK